MNRHFNRMSQDVALMQTDMSSIMGKSGGEEFSNNSTLPSFHTPTKKDAEPTPDSFCEELQDLGLNQL